jgi:hypothetical protein
MSTITFGNTSNPSNISQYMDSVFGLSVANYRKELTDNIGATNSFLAEILKGDAYESADGGSWIQEPLMYALAPSDSYDGYDELSTLPTDGVTDAVYQWRQLASPIVYNMREVILNQHRIVDIVKTRIKQSEMGIQEGFAQSLSWGNSVNGGDLWDPKVSSVNGSNNIEPLSEFVRFDPTSSTDPTVGNIDQSTAANSWWRNRTKQSAANDYVTFILELENIYNQTALGSGGPPNLILMDQVSYELFVMAFFFRYRIMPGDAPTDFPFEAKKFKNALVVMDDKVPDYYSNLAPTSQNVGGLSSGLTYGSAILLNTKFFKLRYHPDRDWEMLEDESGKKFAKPINGDSRVGHVAWMGNLTCNNRRKQGVLGHIARTMTAN